jgi:integrase
MGRGRKGSGVEIREHSIRINFTWQGKWCRETFEIKPTPPNVKHATRVRATIIAAIANDTFKYGDYFPDSPKAKGEHAGDVAIVKCGEKWLKTKGRLSDATKSQYRNALNFWYEQLGGRETPVKGISHTDLAALIGDYEWPSPKLCNNYLIVLRGLFFVARKDRHILEDPTEGISNSKLQNPLPDPFTLEEAERIVTDFHKHYPPSVANYIEFAFFTGMRPEESIAVQWADVDWDARTLRVQRARSFRGRVTPVKGYGARDTELSQRAVEVLKRQKAFTFLKSHGFIFENPVTDEPWHENRPIRETYFEKSLKRLGIRYRGPYHTRHTYATAAIMDGIPAAWVAKQIGNSPIMIQKHYTKWIEQVDNSRQRERLDRVFGGRSASADQFLPNFSPKS